MLEQFASWKLMVVFLKLFIFTLLRFAVVFGKKKKESVGFGGINAQHFIIPIISAKKGKKARV